MTRDEAFSAYLRSGVVSPELRAAGETTSSAGGYMVPEAFREKLAVQLKQYGNLFADFTRFTTSHGREMFAPSANFATAGAAVAEDTGPISANDRVYGSVTFPLTPTIASGVHEVSFQLEEDSAFPVEDIITAYAAESVGRALAGYSVSGTGSAQPLGVIPIATAQGAATLGSTSGGYLNLSAAQAVEINGSASTELTSGALAPSTILKLMQAVDPAYYGDAAWYMNVATYAAQCQVTDTAGQPLIRPNGPRELHGFPIVLANELPSLTASTVGGVTFGSMPKGMYWRDAGFEVKRSVELHGDYLAVSYIGYARYDLNARDARAFATVKPAAT
jgi:HK97 family phage major capsid protein